MVTKSSRLGLAREGSLTWVVELWRAINSSELNVCADRIAPADFLAGVRPQGGFGFG
jgi:hypothetical protein